MEPEPHFGARVAVFGGLQVWRGDSRVDAGPPRQRAVLALLVAATGRTVAVSTLVDAVWPTDPPASAVNQIHRLVGQLRRVFEPDLPPHAAGRLVVAAGAGYRLVVDNVDCDLLRFRELARRADDHVRDGDGLKACRAYVESLEQCAGELLAGLDPRVLSRPELIALERERESVVVAAADVAVRLGVVSPPILDAVEDAAARTPFNEALQAARVRQLAAVGRRAEALAAFDTVRRALADQLGVDPGPELTAAFRELLLDGVDPAVSEPVRGAVGDPAVEEGGVGRTHPPAQLPHAPAGFVDRTEVSLDDLHVDGGGGAVVITAIGGMAGIGKTTLALEWAHRVAGQFPDGQLYVNLRGFDPSGAVVPPEDALAHFLESLGAPPDDAAGDVLGARAARYRSLLAGRRMTVVLDNARDSAQVRPLLPGAPGCLVLVTSRNRLSSLAAHQGARVVTLARLVPADSRRLLTARIGPTRAAAEPEAVERILAACAGLPLALAITAGRLATDPGRPLVDAADELDAPGRRLDALSGDDGDDSLRAALSWSYRALSTDAARLFRHLAAHPGPEMSAASLASMTGHTAARTEQLARELTTGSLLEDRGRTPTGGGRYVVHDLVRAYAGELLDVEAERGAAEGRLVDHYVLATRSAHLLFGRDPLTSLPALAEDLVVEQPADAAASVAWYGRERAVLTAVVDLALARGSVSAAALMLLDLRPMNQTLDALAEPLDQTLRVLAAVDTEVPRILVAELHRDAAARYQHDPRADAHRTRALEIYEELGDVAGLSHLHRNLAALAMMREDYESAYVHALASLEFAERSRQPAIVASSLVMVAGSASRSGRDQEAADAGSRAIDMLRAAGSTELPLALGITGHAQLALGEPELARRLLNEADALLEVLGDPFVEYLVLAGLARAAWLTGDRVAAADAVTRFDSIMAGRGRADLVAAGITANEIDVEEAIVREVEVALKD